MKALSFDDISLVPRYNNITSRRDVDTGVRFGDLDLKIPIFSSNMDTVTGTDMARTMYQLGGLGFLHRFCTVRQNVKLYQQATQTVHEKILSEYPDKFQTFSNCLHDHEAVVSLGVNEGLERFAALYEVGARYFCIDIAHGHSRAVGELITQIKEFSDDTFIVAGNVCHAAGAEYLADRGADAVKVGIGPGSVCSTRVKTGFGVPQFTAIRDCRRVNCFIIADGGIREPGDAVKAIVAGADAVMMGGMLAGTDETPGELITETTMVPADQYIGDRCPQVIDGRPYLSSERHFKAFRGMASKEAQDEYMGSMQDWKTSEGVEIRVPAKGPVANVVSDLMGGIRSGMTYCGANTLSQLSVRADWVEVTAAGRQEGRPHGKERLS